MGSDPIVCPANSPEHHARWRLIRAMSRTPYSGGLAPVTVKDTEPADEFIESVALWLESLAERLVMAGETATNMQRELDGYRHTQRLLREFLGTNQIGES